MDLTAIDCAQALQHLLQICEEESIPLAIRLGALVIGNVQSVSATESGALSIAYGDKQSVAQVLTIDAETLLHMHCRPDGLVGLAADGRPLKVAPSASPRIVDPVLARAQLLLPLPSAAPAPLVTRALFESALEVAQDYLWPMHEFERTRLADAWYPFVDMVEAEAYAAQCGRDSADEQAILAVLVQLRNRGVVGNQPVRLTPLEHVLFNTYSPQTLACENERFHENAELLLIDLRRETVTQLEHKRRLQLSLASVKSALLGRALRHYRWSPRVVLPHVVLALEARGMLSAESTLAAA